MKKETIVVIILAGVMIFSTFGTAILIVVQNNQQSDAVSTDPLASEAEATPAPLPSPDVELPKGDIKKLSTETLTPGDGAAVKKGDTITVNYKGVLASDGTVFDSSYDRGEPITFSLDQVIEGWQEGIVGMKVGELRQLNIPSEKAYKEAGNPPVIGENADLVFVVELLGIGADSAQ